MFTILVFGKTLGESMSDVTIYHNPACGTSRNVLAIIRKKWGQASILLV
jgi:hypothetical protein